MSYYYNYYIGYEKDGKLYPLGPFNALRKDKFLPVLYRSRSFASDLYEDFNVIPKDMYSDELKKALIDSEAFEDEEEYFKSYPNPQYLYFSELGSSDFIKTGYFLIEDIVEYEKNDHDTDGIFYDYLTPTLYAAKAANELTFGKPEKKTDAGGYDYVPSAASDYSYFAYPDYHCKEYETYCIQEALHSMINSVYINEEKDGDIKFVVIETEG